MFKTGSTKPDNTTSNDGSIKVKKVFSKGKMANTTSTKRKKIMSFLSLPRQLRQHILRAEFNAYIPLELTYRRRGERLGYINKLAVLYKRAVPECIKDIDYVARKANEAVEKLLKDPDYYC
ncbi:hypothetical protein E2P81_ATG00121 [Venturia nashicola]|uniref:Uncharacterized protein n=1 Tax=Venturia nashicola TaxID=86259 RepID=A0A4Z1PVZ1_9PEZI|nr:hypothetical protein E6O75_ATG00129 [Venturia nashicola]TLD39134.1 hypothetical protein E2P81_ATG00121 [Venturia nashicola]